MYTLKIHWYRAAKPDDPGDEGDVTDLFIAADQVEAQGWYNGAGSSKLVEDWAVAGAGVLDYTFEMVVQDGIDLSSYRVERADSRLITVTKNDTSTWYLASRAWLLGPDGKTIERLA